MGHMVSGSRPNSVSAPASPAAFHFSTAASALAFTPSSMPMKSQSSSRVSAQ